MTTLPGDSHRLGIQMCAAVTARTEAQVIYPEPNTPSDDIISAMSESQADVLCISVSPTMDPVKEIKGVTCINSFSEYFDWLTASRHSQKNQISMI